MSDLVEKPDTPEEAPKTALAYEMDLGGAIQRGLDKFFAKYPELKQPKEETSVSNELDKA